MKSFLLSKWGIALMIVIVVFVLLLVTAPDIGLTWDEPAYIAGARSYMSWYAEAFLHPAQAFTQESIDRYWSINHEHPPLDKIWSGVVYTITRTTTDDLSAHRMGNMILVAILAGLIYVLLSDAYGKMAGFAAVAGLMSMPRFFFHAHLAALDVPAAVSVFITTFIFWKTLEKKNWKWGLLLGLVWGLALATKINAVFVPVVIGIWWLIFRREMRIFWRVAIMGFSAIPVFLLSWPWLYVQTIDRLVEYILFITTNHWEIGQYYLGQFYMPPPWHFGFVMLWAVLPLSLTILYLGGIFRSIKMKDDHHLGWLLLISAVVPILAIAAGKSMVYDNERLIMASFPFLACLAGMGFGWLVSSWQQFAKGLKKPILQPIGMAVLIILAFVPQFISLVRLYPHYLSYYGESVGGLSGATRMGLETTYWCETYNLALPIINAQAAPKDRIWADPWSYDVLIYYQMEGRLRDDVKIISPSPTISGLGKDAPQPVSMPMNAAHWYIFQHRQTTLGGELENNPILKVLANQEAVYEYSYDGVPIMTLYKSTLR